MGLALVLIVLGILIFMERMGIGYGIREGWPWMVVALGFGGLLRKTKSLAAWITILIGIFILATKYYSMDIQVPHPIKAYLLPVILIVVGLLWLYRHKRD